VACLYQGADVVSLCVSFVGRDDVAKACLVAMNSAAIAAPKPAEYALWGTLVKVRHTHNTTHLLLYDQDHH
jgi:hypothetical protein